MRHEKSVEGVVFDSTQHPVDDLALLVEVATETAMDLHGNLSFLSRQRWQSKRRRLATRQIAADPEGD
jgi:hypothetical protein